MQEKLILFLHARDLTRPSWAVVNVDGFCHQQAVTGTSDELAQLAEDKEVIVIVPAEDVLLTNVNLPKMSRSRLLQALPFALEEQLIEEVEKLHFAPGDYQEGGALPVAIVARDKMQQWLALLQAWNIKADAMYSAVFALPATYDAWQIVVNEMAVVRTSLYSGFACDKENFVEYMQLALSRASQLPEAIDIHNYSSHEYTAVLPAKVHEEFLKQDQYTFDLAVNVGKTPSIDLFQGQYTVKKSRLPQRGKIWKTAAYLAIAWVGLLFLYPIMSYLILQQRVSAMDDQITEIYQRQFPDASNVVAPKLRMEEKLHKLSAQIGENKLLLLMGYIGKGMLETESIKLKRFDFQNNQLTLELTAANSEDFASFADFLTKNGLSVKQQNANLAGTRINATLQVE